ncbi:MAG: 5'/3'-nucleotidase SurE, partial [Planctomycetota bacterium]
VNDDGIEAPGLRALYHALRKGCNMPVLAVAPHVERSGQGHAITLQKGLRITPVWDSQDDFFGFAINGTPVDCCKLALKVIAPEQPRMVISGINDGPNVGRSLFYSGTVGAALEAAVEGYCALAISLDRSEHPAWQAAADLGVRLAKRCMRHASLLRGHVLNVNIPVQDPSLWGPVRVLPHGLSGFEERYAPQAEKDGSVRWILDGERIELDHEGETDAHALRAGHPTMSILQPDFNSHTQGLVETLAKLPELSV